MKSASNLASVFLCCVSVRPRRWGFIQNLCKRGFFSRPIIKMSSSRSSMAKAIAILRTWILVYAMGEDLFLEAIATKGWKRLLHHCHCSRSY